MSGKRKDAQQLTKDLEDVIRKLYAQIQGTDEEKRETIIQEVGTYIESEEKARQEKQERAKELRKQKKDDKVDKFKQRAAEIPDDTETLMEEFNYKSREVVNACMAKYGIYGKIKILQAIKEKVELGMSEEEANAQIAKEGNVTVQAVARIRDQKKEKQENSEKEKKERQSKRKDREDKSARFKARAAEIPDDTETLMEEFNYKSREVVNAYMAKYGIYGKIKILQAIQEKVELGISEEEANAQIAKEGNVTAEAVARIRQGISKPKTKSTRANVKPSSTQTITSDKSEVQTDARTVVVQPRVAEPKTEQSAKTTEEPKVKIWGIWESTQTPNKPIAHTKNTKPRVKPNVANTRQKAKQVSKNEIEEVEQREIQQKKLEKELQQISKKELQIEQSIKKETEIFLKMARQFQPIEAIKGKFQYIDSYDMILLLRKHKIASREEVEELIETTTLSDEEIAQKANGEAIAVKAIRESIKNTQKLIENVSDTKRNFIIGLIKQSRIC